MTAHSDRAHAKLAPSSASRWWNCPGSVRMSAGRESASSVYADEGTAAHTLAERCLRDNVDADHWLGGCVDIKNGKVVDSIPERMLEKPGVFEVDEDMAAAVQVYLDLVRSVVEEGDEWEIETRLDISEVHPDIFGTGDLVCYKPDKKKLLVVDYKHGKGITVDPTENKQLMTYAVGATLRHSNRGLDEVELIVVQPRAVGEPVKSWKTDALSMLEWRFDLEEAAKRTEEPNAPLAAGEWCRFCPALTDCPAHEKMRADLAQAEFDDAGAIVLPEPSTVAPERLALIVKNANIFKDWFRRVEAFAHAEAMEGRVPPGLNLVAKRATRKWKNEAEAEEFLVLYGLDSEQLFEKKFKSPAKIEALIGRAGKQDINDLIVAKSSGVNLVSEDDERPAIKTDALSEFFGE